MTVSSRVVGGVDVLLLALKRACFVLLLFCCLAFFSCLWGYHSVLCQFSSCHGTSQPPLAPSTVQFIRAGGLVVSFVASAHTLLGQHNKLLGPSPWWFLLQTAAAMLFLTPPLIYYRITSISLRILSPTLRLLAHVVALLSISELVASLVLRLPELVEATDAPPAPPLLLGAAGNSGEKAVVSSVCAR
jgi:hypothetical protein